MSKDQSSTDQWTRVLDLIESLEEFPSSQVEEKIKDLQAGGEQEHVVRRLRTHLRIPNTQKELPSGSLIDNEYLITDTIGVGGMGIVYQAKLRKTGQIVALKMIHPDLLISGARDRFLLEMQSLGKLDHPGIVKVLHAGSHIEGADREPIEYFTMERLQGHSLHEYLKTRDFTVYEKLSILRDLAVAVEYAHERDIVHRDLKPANIMILQGGSVKILDFGIASALNHPSDNAYTCLGEGTPPYMAPEQVSGMRSSIAADVYSMGVILYEILINDSLYRLNPLDSYTKKIETIKNPPIPSPITIPGVSKAVIQLIEKSLALDPEDRFSSAADLARAINRTLPARHVLEPPQKWVPKTGVVVPATNWQLVKLLGQGTNGQVWLAENCPRQGNRKNSSQLQPRVFKFCTSEESARALRREVRFFKALHAAIGKDKTNKKNTPHILPIESWSLDAPPYYISMIHIQNACNLSEWVKNNQVSEESSIEIVIMISEALTYAHDIGVLHRDIKPDNILVAPDENTKNGTAAWLIDFGLAGFEKTFWMRSFSESLSAKDEIDHLVGTPDYIAPEVRKHEPHSIRSDLYSLGVVFYRLLREDFNAPLNEWKQHISDPLLLEDIDQCLNEKTDKRFSSAAEFHHRLRTLKERRESAKAAKEEEKLQETKRKRELNEIAKAAYRKGVIRASLTALSVIFLFGWLTWFSRQQYIKSWENESNLRLTEISAIRQSTQPNRNSRITDNIRAANKNFPNHTRLSFRNEAFASLAIPPSLKGNIYSLGNISTNSVFTNNSFVQSKLSTITRTKINQLEKSSSTEKLTPLPLIKLAVTPNENLVAGISENNLLYASWNEGDFVKISDTCALGALAVHESGLIVLQKLNGTIEILKRNQNGWKVAFSINKTRPELTEPSLPEPHKGPFIDEASLIAFNKAGNLIAIVDQSSLYVQIWDLEKKKRKAIAAHKHFPTTLIWDNLSENRFWTGSADGIVYGWNLSKEISDKPTISISKSQNSIISPSVHSLAVSTDGRHLICVRADGSLAFYFKSNLHEDEIHISKNVYRCGYFSNGAIWTISKNGSGTIYLPDIARVSTKKLSYHPITQLVRDPKNEFIGASTTREIFLLKNDNFLNDATLLSPSARPTGLTFDVDQRKFYTMSVKGLDIWTGEMNDNYYSWEKTGPFSNYGKGGEILCFVNQVARWLIISHGNKITGIEFPLNEAEIKEHSFEGIGVVTSLAAGHNNDWFAAARTGNRPIEFQFIDEQYKQKLYSEYVPVMNISTPPNASFIVERTENGIRLSDTSSFKLLKKWHLKKPLPDPRINPIKKSPITISDDGQIIVAIGEHNQIVLYDKSISSPIAEFKLPNDARPISLCFSDSRKLFAGTAEGQLWQWDLKVIEKTLLELGLGVDD